MSGYTAYILNEKERNALLDVFAPQFSNIYAHHITNEFNVLANTDIPELEKIEITHHISDGNGLECLVFKINDKNKALDGRYYHMTWSIDPEANLPAYILNVEADAKIYEQKHSNILIETAFNENCPEYIHVQELSCAIPPCSFEAKHLTRPVP